MANGIHGDDASGALNENCGACDRFHNYKKHDMRTKARGGNKSALQ